MVWSSSCLKQESYYSLTKMAVHHRILYFFHDQRAVISHGLTKKGAVPTKEIDLAIHRKDLFNEEPSQYI